MSEGALLSAKGSSSLPPDLARKSHAEQKWPSPPQCDTDLLILWTGPPHRAQSAIGATGSSSADQRKVHFDVAYAKVDNSVEVTVDRFGCTSKFLSPLR